MAYRTLKQLRHELQARLGYGAAGAAANVNQPILDSFLQGAQVALYWLSEWRECKTYLDVSTPANGSRLTYPTDAQLNRIGRLSVNRGSVPTPNWTPLTEGIEDAHYSTMGQPSYPVRFERFADGIELWPNRDQTYTVRIFYMAALLRFSEDKDVATIDDSLIFLFALANAKGHYKHADAGTYATQVQAIMNQLKRGAFGSKRFIPENQREPDPEPRPVVI